MATLSTLIADRRRSRSSSVDTADDGAPPPPTPPPTPPARRAPPPPKRATRVATPAHVRAELVRLRAERGQLCRIIEEHDAAEAARARAAADAAEFALGGARAATRAMEEVAQLERAEVEAARAEAEAGRAAAAESRDGWAAAEARGAQLVALVGAMQAEAAAERKRMGELLSEDEAKMLAAVQEARSGAMASIEAVEGARRPSATRRRRRRR